MHVFAVGAPIYVGVFVRAPPAVFYCVKGTRSRMNGASVRLPRLQIWSVVFCLSDAHTKNTKNGSHQSHDKFCFSEGTSRNARLGDTVSDRDVPQYVTLMSEWTDSFEMSFI